MDDRPYVIAVFGSTLKDTYALARSLGREIGSRNLILLTGGVGPDDVGVKGQAIGGILQNLQGKNLWIGVANSSDSREAEVTDHSLILKPGFRDKRNFIEACICDAAIVLNGNEGTTSEAIFSILRQKPVISIDNHIITIKEITQNLKKLINDVFKRVEEENSHHLGNYFTNFNLLEELGKIKQLMIKELSVGNSDPDVAAKDIVHIVESLLQTNLFLRGDYPVYKNGEARKNEFDKWIAGF